MNLEQQARFRDMYDRICLCGCPGATHVQGDGECMTTELSQGLEGCDCKRFKENKLITV